MAQIDNNDPADFSSGDELDAEQNAKIVSARAQGRRRSNIDPITIDVANLKDYVKPVFEKDDDTKAMLRESIANSATLQVLVSHLPDRAIDDIINAFEPMRASEGDMLIAQGDGGDCLYIIGDGTADVFVKRRARTDSSPQSGKGDQVSTLGPGALFGELALMYTAPRAASVVVTSGDCLLWRLHREPFKMLVISSVQQKYALYEGWLRDVELLSVLNDYELARLSEAMTSDFFDDGETIVQQGDIGDKFYILEDGVCHAYIKKEGGQEVMVKEYVTPGDYFGEISLLLDEPRRATIRAGDGGTKVVSISKTDFTNLLGPLQDALKDDIANYTSAASY